MSVVYKLLLLAEIVFNEKLIRIESIGIINGILNIAVMEAFFDVLLAIADISVNINTNDSTPKNEHKKNIHSAFNGNPKNKLNNDRLAILISCNNKKL
jgi:hypothetical protein